MSSGLKLHNLHVYNSLSRQKEKFEPLNPPFVGMYVCGPTVYGDAHLGHARPAIAFDIVFRYLKYLGYKVRYVRNITDVGHLENDADFGEDKIAKKAKLEALEPMEVVQYFSDRYRDDMRSLNVLSPSIEPRASGHIIEQIEMAEKIKQAGYAYEANGSLYFDVVKYNRDHNYGVLSGRNVEEVVANTRDLDGQDEKRESVDFALWKKAAPEHIMRWNSPWSLGFPGWHMECSAMSTKYLGERFDIHGGGMELRFPHHESEIAQSVAANGQSPVKYWLHNNMVTINGQKMGKSLGNFINLEQFFNGNHPLLEKSYDPMTIRFFMLQAHYRSTVDFSNEALQAAEKGLQKFMTAYKMLDGLSAGNIDEFDVDELEKKGFDALNDDFNTPVLIAHLFDAVRVINSVKDGKMNLTAQKISQLKSVMSVFIFDILGLSDVKADSKTAAVTDGLVQMILEMRLEARKNKDWAASDRLRDKLKELGIAVKDSKEGSTWEWETGN